MRNVNFLLKTFFLGVMMMAFSFEGHSQFNAVANKKGNGGTGSCTNCTLTEIYDVSFTITPTHFPFKVDEISFTDITQGGPSILLGGTNTLTISNFNITNPITQTIVPNQVIYANSPLLNSQNELEITVRIVPAFCLGPNQNIVFFKGYLLNSVLSVTNYGQGPGNSDVSSNLSRVIGLDDPCGIISINPFLLFSKTTSQVNSGKEFDNGENEWGENQISIFPNPFQNKLEVKFVLKEKMDLDIKIFNQMGQKINVNSLKNSYPQGEYTSIINLEEQPAGIYYIHVSSPSKKEVFKILKTQN